MSQIITKFSLRGWKQIGFQTTLNVNKTNIAIRTFKTSGPLNAEPPKKKRRLDPTILKSRVERKIKKHEREIAKLEAAPKQLIPIQEYQLTNSEIRELESRPGRTLEDANTSMAEYKAATRLWTIYSNEQSRMMANSIRRVEASQENALKALKELDESLYRRTVELDECSLIPYISSHVRKETPENPKYKCPDGYLKNTTKDWVM